MLLYIIFDLSYLMIILEYTDGNFLNRLSRSIKNTKKFPEKSMK